MLNRKKDQTEKWEELFTLLELSAEEKRAAGAYLSGEQGKEALAEIEFKDLSSVSGEAVRPFFYDLMQKQNRSGLESVKDDMGRLFKLLYARGKTTCHAMIPLGVLKTLQQTEWWNAPRMAAVYAAETGGQGYLNDDVLKSVLAIAGNDPKNLKQAFALEENLVLNGKFVLLALYFYEKYQKSTEVVTEPDDLELLSKYEEIAVRFLGSLYFNSTNPALLDELSQGVAAGQIPERFAPLVDTYPQVSTLKLRLTAGLSYLNYTRSEKLKNIVRLCLLAGMTETLEALCVVSRGSRMDICTKGGLYDRVFGIDSEKYLSWAARGHRKNILRKQLEENTDCYIRVMDFMPAEPANQMLLTVKEEKPKLYKELVAQRQKNGNSMEKEKLIEAIVKKDANLNVAKEWLRGESTMEEFCARFDRKLAGSTYAGAHEWDLVSGYYINYEDEEFYRRCEVYMLFECAGAFFGCAVRGQNQWSATNLEVDRVKKLFADFEAEGVALSLQAAVVSMIYDRLYNEDDCKEFINCINEYFGNYLKERREDALKAFAEMDVFTRCIALRLLAQDAGQNKAEILKYTQDGSKAVKEQLFEILCAHRDWDEEIKNLLTSKKAAEREFAIKVLLHWQEAGADYRECLTQAMEREKNVKVKELLGNALGMEESGEAKGQMVSRAELVKSLHKGGKKRGLAWAYETPFPVVHGADRAVADEEYLQAILLCYVSADDCGVSKNAAFLAEVLDAGEFAVYVNELFDKWMEAGAEAKKRWVLYAAAIHGGSAIVEKLHRQIKEWPGQSRGAIACEAVKALSLSPLPQALLIVDGIARKFKFKQVRAAAGEALEFAAAQLGITREELADRIVPDFGFDEKVERVFDYGERKFVVTLTTALEIEVFEGVEVPQAAGSQSGAGSGMKEKEDSLADGEVQEDAGNSSNGVKASLHQNIARGKKLKNLPAPGKKDDEQKAAAAYEEFKQLKKQMKTTVSSQKQRLEMALSTAREWSVDAWKQLFVKNPIMHQFAIGLIWGIYEDGKLTQSFRYMEDGSFNTEDEEEFVLPADGGTDADGKSSLSGEPSADGKSLLDGDASADKKMSAGEKVSARRKIGLVHPVELSEESKAAWKEQLSDYEITQPFEQLDRTVYMMTEEEADTQELTRFQDQEVNDLSLSSRLFALGWYRGSVQDAGCFETYYREDGEIGLGVELHFSGSYVGGENEEVTVYGARFYKAGTIARGSYMYDEADEEKAYFLRDVPARYFSEVVWQLTKAVMGAG